MQHLSYCLKYFIYFNISEDAVYSKLLQFHDLFLCSQNWLSDDQIDRSLDCFATEIKIQLFLSKYSLLFGVDQPIPMHILMFRQTYFQYRTYHESF